MPSHHHLSTLSLISYLLFFCPYITPISSSALSPASPPDSSDKVRLGLYYESLCPYSANFVVNYLVKIFETGLISVVDLHLVPWGNAKLRANNTFDCQHGPVECLLNTIEACAISVWPDLNKHFSFIYCVETLVYEHKYSEWETCFDKLGLDATPIYECYTSGNGTELELQYAGETNTLQPPHEYVPWVVVDGQPLYDDYENFTSYICEAYKGAILPNTCSDTSLKTIRKTKRNNLGPVCYREEATKSLSSKIRSALTSWLDKADGAV
jgi:interferon gamma-inducible protein 30